MRRPSWVSRSSSSLMGVMSALISMTAVSSPSSLMGAVVTRTFLRLPCREVTTSSRVWEIPSARVCWTGQGSHGVFRCL